MAIQRYEVDPLDGEYRCDSGNWVQYEDHVLEMGLLKEHMIESIRVLEGIVSTTDGTVRCLVCKAVESFIAEIRDSMIQSTHGKETDGPAVSD